MVKKKPTKPRKKKKKKIGRPTAYRSKYIQIVHDLAVLGITEADIAYYIGINPETFRRWKHRHPELSGSLKKGQAERNVRLTTALFTSAIKKQNTAAMIFLAKNWLGMRDQTDITLPDVTSDDNEILVKVIHVNGSTPKPEDKKKTGREKGKRPKPQGKPPIPTPQSPKKKQLKLI